MMVRVPILNSSLNFELTPHPIDEPPASRAEHVGYVGFSGTSNIKVAVWKGGQWVDHRKRPFKEAPSCWHSLELQPRG